ncbi:hypothetical protein [Delftia tsuruhatensis]|jgi:hypothetical protein|uniref:hypothetical protein n=1 Tax=Delftia tsuruhatensis TaxID=180282 RepID=UPI00244BC1C2|nr:hypothetical protein [Delftia tsuruhatensis]MDH1827166.1 hypothetical protein [Delftia tsuruhatensis]
MNQPQIDPISAAVAVASVVFAPAVAHVVGPYLVILFASTIGASFALVARERTSGFNSVLFFVRVNGLSVLLTYSVSAVVNAGYPIEDQRAWFSPVAFVIGFIGDRWPAVMGWAARKVSRLVDILIKMRGDGGGHG